jgi:ABC-2 type transport system ATP-binding protein
MSSSVITRQAGSTVARSGGGIQASGLAKEFKGGIHAVAGIDLNVAPGEIFGLLGPNGSGKTTTVEMLVTLSLPTSGHASVGGCDVVDDAAEVRMLIGVALQEVALDPLMTAWDHMRLQCTLQGLARHEGRTRAEELVKSVDLVDAANRRTRTYSGGMKRRLDLALALVHRPKVLFLDEPTTGLDPHSRAAIWEEVRRLAKEEGVAVFLTTQYLDEADALADRVAIIDRGRIVIQGSPHELKSRVGDRSIVVRAGTEQAPVVAGVLSTFGHAKTGAGGAVRCQLPSDGVDLAIIVRALDAASIKVESLNVHAPTLDDVFFAETGRPLGADGDAG